MDVEKIETTQATTPQDIRTASRSDKTRSDEKDHAQSRLGFENISLPAQADDLGDRSDFPNLEKTKTPHNDSPSQTGVDDDLTAACQTPLPPSIAPSIIVAGPSRLALEAPAPEQSSQYIALYPGAVVVDTSKKPVPKPEFWNLVKAVWGPGSKSKRKQSIALNPEPVQHASATKRLRTEAYRADIRMQYDESPFSFSNVAAEGTRHKWSSRIVLYDWLGSTPSDTPKRTEPWKDETEGPTSREFQNVMMNISSPKTQRIVLVEDLSPRLIDLLGATLGIPPQVFEDHLDRSGYNPILGKAVNPSAWRSRYSVQGYSSMTWYRPVISVVPVHTEFRDRLVEGYSPLLRTTSNDGGKVRVVTTSNIWRPNLKLSPEPGACHKGCGTEYPVGWEEKATIWVNHINGHHFVVILLDPLPRLTYEGSAVDNQRKVRTSRKETQQQSQRRTDAPPRPEIMIEIRKSRNTRIQPIPVSPHVRDWVMQSPHPTVNDSSPTLEPLAPPPDPPEPPLSPIREGDGSDATLIPYQPIKARLSSSTEGSTTATALQRRSHLDSLKNASSTLAEFEHFLQVPKKGKVTAFDPLRGLFLTIHDDTISLVEVIRFSLQRIREDIMDENILQERVTFWRRLLHRLNFSVAGIESQLRALSHFVEDSEITSLDSSKRAELPSQRLANETREALRDCVALLDKCSSSLLSEMQIVDSRRSIVEAESISKLTELAFVFIPLSFVASLFSMQIHELDGGVPLYKFVLVAIGFVLVAYAVRLSIRSSRLIDYRTDVMHRIRKDSNIQANHAISTQAFVIWSGNALGKTMAKTFGAHGPVLSWLGHIAPLILILGIIAAMVSPIVVLWLRSINQGFSAVITVLMLLLDVVLLFPLMLEDSGTFGFSPKKIIREIRSNLDASRMLSKRADKLRKQTAGVDPESQPVDSIDGSDMDIRKRRSSPSATSSSAI